MIGIARWLRAKFCAFQSWLDDIDAVIARETEIDA